MTDFQRASSSLEEIKNICSELLNAREEEVFNKLSLYQELEEKLKKLEPIITRIRIRRNEKDESKKTYGEKMIKNVDTLLERYDIVYNIYEEELAIFKENYEIEKKKIVAKKLQQEQQRKEHEAQLLNRGREETKMEHLKIQRMNEEKMRSLQKTQEDHAQRMKRVETIKEIIQEKCNFLCDEIAAACDRAAAVEYVYTQLGVDAGDAQSSNGFPRGVDEEGPGADKLPNVTNPAKTVNPTNDAKSAVHLVDCLYLVYKQNDFKAFKEALQNIIEYLTHLVKNVDDEQMKLINLMNQQFQKNILSKKGTLLLFVLIGYVVKKASDVMHILKKLNRPMDEKNIYMYLEEPDIAADYEGWKCWYDGLQISLDVLCSFFRFVNKYSNLPADEQVQSTFLYLRGKFGEKDHDVGSGTA
ncbi:conserved Plasmodium protein, unknown function [Plasmodium knowlesi strain H]|uniref:Uncharacterized protein n=3 Tax=Plasmodium knowlesi TaxID=5850 RepID=A0A5K1VJD8_PLAKH|nr:PUB domain-containing protein, putative [Plasmodium knowlesi strain H]OTN66530.1 Uncharacterized protein PKNOH_S09527400 [Plasmodium knowlesi]CAA9990033.1 PUB domain-containing protein, putative [Plasmodium knowlesi strain H]SBO24638.1 conserved Plasmodium protein, unknown function [Plasmodium knowlesi strain H]SBO26164.1 conserved Plasmodium protein, unknown function [Plasmodium knowlesi strain H]VVS79507.1 PUB domain-containing protein, putative [Plasmodium knowlesi strain H]|eukprot:XP_002260048.1 hypothetical protein, conserved in Plasmodium species [Plasmodium knowlesi strain H]